MMLLSQIEAFEDLMHQYEDDPVIESGTIQMIDSVAVPLERNPPSHKLGRLPTIKESMTEHHPHSD